MAINKISNEMVENIKRKTACALPNEPSKAGVPPERIKSSSYRPLTDTDNSIISEINRIVEEANEKIARIVSGEDLTFLSNDTTLGGATPSQEKVPTEYAVSGYII